MSPTLLYKKNNRAQNKPVQSHFFAAAAAQLRVALQQLVTSPFPIFSERNITA
jgi:hypothetical protein